MSSSDLIIIGGGVLGSFHALHALERGLSVRLFERHPRPMGASVRNFGQVVPSGMDSKWQAYGRKSLEIYKRLQQSIDLSIRPLGSVYLASDEEEVLLLEELHAINQQNDYPSERLSAVQCLERYPGLRTDYCQGGLFFPEEISVEADQMVHRLLAFLIEQLGLNYHPSTQIREINVRQGRAEVISATGNTYEAENVILCSGHEFRTLYPELFANSDLEVSKLQMMRTVPQSGLRIPGNILTGLSIRRYEAFRECPSYAAIKAEEDPNALWKKWGVHILFKQSPDGSVIVGDSHHYADAVEAEAIGYDILPEVNAYMLAEAKKIFQLEDWSLQSEWFGVYSQCKEQDIFHHSIDDHIHIVTGIGGKGMTGSAGYSLAHINSLYQSQSAVL